jgi:hypothetical protein
MPGHDGVVERLASVESVEHRFAAVLITAIRAHAYHIMDARLTLHHANSDLQQPADQPTALVMDAP